MIQSELTQKKIVVMGGGNGSAVSLVALKKLKSEIHDLNISAVISMSDSGHSSGAIRRHFNMLPPGDILRAVLALSPYEFTLLKKIFYKNRVHNLKQWNIDLKASRGPNLGNLFLALVGQYEHDFVSAVRALEEIVEAIGHAFPATLEQCDLVAELSDVSIVKGETKIDEPTYDRNLKIKKVWLEPEVLAYEEACGQIENAHCIVFGPGDLYTSIVASLLPRGISDAIGGSKARLIYVVGNAYHAQGETGPETLSGFITGLEAYLPRPLDYIIFNNARLNAVQQKTYTERGWNLITQDIGKKDDPRIITDNYERGSGGLCSIKLSHIFKELSARCT